MGRSFDSDFLPEQYVYIWHEDGFYFVSKPPFIAKTKSKMYAFTFSPEGKLINKEISEWAVQ